MTLIDEYDDHTFPDEAVSKMAATFADREQMMFVAGLSDGAQAAQTGVELFTAWKAVCQYYDVDGETERKSLVLQGLERFLDDSKEQAIAEMAYHIEDI